MQTVLVVEDEKLIRKGIATMIKRSGVPVEEVLECSNGLQALDILRQQRVDVMFTDIRMPKMNGIELVRAMQEIDDPPMTIAVSGYDDFSYAVEMMRQGVREYILKPVERDKLREILEKLEKEISDRKESDQKTRDAGKQLLKYILLDEKAEGDDLTLMENRLRKVIGDEYYCLVVPAEDEINEDIADLVTLSGIDDMTVVILDKERKSAIYEKYVSEGEISFAGISSRYTDVKDLKKAFAQAREDRERNFCTSRKLFESSREVNIREELRENGRKLCEKGAVAARVQLLGTDRTDVLTSKWQGFFTAVEREFITPREFLDAMTLFSEEYRAVYQKDVPEMLLRPFSFQNLGDYREEFMDFIIDSNDRLSALTGSDESEAKMQKAVKYIRENYNRDLNMAVVSNEISMNYSLFSSAFKAYTGTNFVNFVKDLRMQEAKKLLEETDLKVSEIAARVGYDNEKHFMKLFKADNLVSPSEYRKNMTS